MVPEHLVESRILFLNKTEETVPSITQTRTIQILPHIFKALESILLTRLSNFLDSKQIINDKQRGFCKDKTTAQNLVDVFSFMERAKQARGALLFLDLKEAFNKVNRSILIRKLKRISCPEYLINLFIDIFKKTKIRTSDGSTVPISIGVM